MTDNYYKIPKKKKYIDNSNKNLNGILPGVWQYSDNNIITNETKLRSKLSNVNKNNFERINKFDSINYNIPLQSKSNKKNVQFNRLPGTHYGPGKGFGNIDILNNLRNGSSTRLESEQWKKDKEMIVNDRFEYLNRNTQNPNNIVLPFPRGGEMTRKIKTNTKDYKIKFKY